MKKVIEICDDQVEELRKEVQNCKKDWEGSKAKVKREAEEWLERERKKWEEDVRVLIEGFKERWRKVLQMVPDKEVEIRRLKEIVADNWEERMATYENITKQAGGQDFRGLL